MCALQVNPIRRIIAVLKLSKKVLKAIEQGELVVDSMDGNAYFTTPVPALADITAKINIVRDKQIEAAKRTQGAAEDRNAAMVVMAKYLSDERNYVQGIADADPANSEAIILSAGMKVKILTIRGKGVFAVRNSDVSGTVFLFAKGGGPRTSHDWQMGTGPAVFNPLPNTIQAHTQVTGLTPGSRVYFRHRLVTKDGPQGWENPISLIIT